MPNLTTCTKCGCLYEANSEEVANEHERLCRICTNLQPCPECASGEGGEGGAKTIGELTPEQVRETCEKMSTTFGYLDGFYYINGERYVPETALAAERKEVSHLKRDRHEWKRQHAMMCRAWTKLQDDYSNLWAEEQVTSAERDNAEGRLAESKSREKRLWACLRRMAKDTARATWDDGDEEMRVLFCRAVDDGDLLTVCAALKVEVEDE